MQDKLTLHDVMRRTWLIQRLQKPHNSNPNNPLTRLAESLTATGLAPGTLKVLRSVCSFDYMGSAEFEWGAIPAAFQFLAEQAAQNNLITATIKAAKPIYIITPRPYLDQVKKRVESLTKYNYDCYCDGQKSNLKEYCGLYDYLTTPANAREQWRRENVGWLEIDNGFMFFVDADMYLKFCILFGIEELS